MILKLIRTGLLFLVGGALLSAAGALLAPVAAAALDTAERSDGILDLDQAHRANTLSGIGMLLTFGQLVVVVGAIKLFSQLFDRARS